MNSFIFILLISKFISDFIQVSANDDILLLDFFSSTSIDNDNQEHANNSSFLNLPDHYEITNGTNLGSNQNSNGPINNLNNISYNALNENNSTINSNYVLANQTNNIIIEPSFKTNFKLKKQKIFFGKKLLLWKRNAQPGYGAFLMLCEPDITCVTPQTKLAIANCMNNGGSALANQLYNSCSNQNRIQCTDQDIARRLLGCLRLQSANNILISPQSRACVRQVVTLGTLDCFVRILRQKPKYRLGTRYSTLTPDAGAGVTAAGIGEGNGEAIEPDPDDLQNGSGRKKMNKREIDFQIYENSNSDKMSLINDRDRKAASILSTVNDSLQLITMNNDDDIYSDLNKTFSNDTYNDQFYNETSDSYENYDPIYEIANDLKSNQTINDTTSSEDDEFDEVIDGEDYESIPINNSLEISSTMNFSLSLNNQTTNLSNQIDLNEQTTQMSLNRSKRQCRNNRHYNNRKWRSRDRSGRSNRRPHNHYKNTPNLKDDDEDEERKWELMSEREHRKG